MTSRESYEKVEIGNCWNQGTGGSNWKDTKRYSEIEIIERLHLLVLAKSGVHGSE